MAILQWVIPSGGIGAGIAWIAHRKSRKAREAASAKEVHDTFKAMYADVSALLEKTQKKYEEIQTELEKIRTENGSLKRVVNGLKRAIQSIQKCPHSMDCPVRDELSVEQIGDDGDGVKGQHVERGTNSCDVKVGDRSSKDGHSSDGDRGLGDKTSTARRKLQREERSDQGESDKNVAGSKSDV